MPSYNAPGVYIHDVVSGAQTIDQASSSIGALIGVTRAGTLNVAQKIGSWTEFIEKFANGLDTPFMANSYLPYSVYGFFQNGGKNLYICSIKKKDAVVAEASASTQNGITAKAKSAGVWGNDLKIELKKAEGWIDTENEIFNVIVSLGASDSVTIKEVNLDTFLKEVNANPKVQKWFSEIKIANEKGKLIEETVTLSKGTDGSALEDSDYTDALATLDALDDVTMVAIPGQTSKAVNDALMAYCDNNGLFPMLDMPIGSTAEQAKAYRKSISAFTGSLSYPWGKMNDPLTNTLKTVPTCGHLMGVYARTIESRGVHKAPAGTDAVVRGFIEMETAITRSQLETLNPIGVICIMSKPNAGIVVWGARSLNGADTTMRYVSDGLLNLNIKRSLYNGTQFAVFEPNDENLWSRVNTSCKAFLEMLRQNGALKGDKDEAYYVTVDGTNNTDATINAGQLNIEIGYAPVKPAEFVIIKLAHSIVSEG